MQKGFLECGIREENPTCPVYDMDTVPLFPSHSTQTLPSYLADKDLTVWEVHEKLLFSFHFISAPKWRLREGAR